MVDRELLILTSLASGPKHGYAIMADVESMTGLRIGPGTMYAAIPRLERAGLIEALESSDRRRPYRLTGQGQETLRRQLESMHSLSVAGLGRLGAT
jgi:DNA-binding PadR family transcriptional regulator